MNNILAVFLASPSDCCGKIPDGWFSNWFYDRLMFPGLPFEIAKYAVCLLLGIIAAYLICTPEGERMGIRKDHMLTLVIITVPLCVLGGRIVYMLTDGVSTFANKIEAYGFFKGVFGGIMSAIGFDNAPSSFEFYGISGLAVHGVIIMVFVMIAVGSFWRKWNIKNVADMVTPGLLIGQILGRWGNFFNREAHGIVVGGWTLEGTKLIPKLTIEAQYQKLLNMGIPKFIANNMCLEGETYYYGLVDGVQTYGTLSGYAYYYPTFLFESLLNLAGLILYFVARRKFKKMRTGMITAAYMIWYGVVRFFIEIIRTDSLYINFFGLPVKNAQVASALLVLAGIGLMIYLRFFDKKPEYYQDAIKKGEINKENETDEDVVVKIDEEKEETKIKVVPKKAILKKKKKEEDK